MGRVLVTGANGHLGCNVVRALLAAGHEVVPMVRDGADTQGLDPLGLAYVRGDILDAGAVGAGMDGCTHVVHLAAVYKTSGPAEEILRPAMDGVRNVLEAAAAHGVTRVVHASSTVAVGTSIRPDAVRDEMHWNDEPPLPYYQAKTDSERRASELATSLGVALVSINPSAILGAYDYRITPTTRYIVDLANGAAPAINGGHSYVDVRDVAHALTRALTEAKAGERYLVTGPNVTYRQVADLVSELTGVRVPYLPTPRPLLPVVIPILNLVARAQGKAPLTVAEGRAVTGRYAYYDSRKAQAAFGFTPRSTAESIAETLRWAAFRGWLKPKVAERITGRLPPDPAWSAAVATRAEVA